jgi:uncharacterized protein YjbI with pentapeptide repeats
MDAAARRTFSKEALLTELKNGANSWNLWRVVEQVDKPDLSGAQLSGFDLSKFDLRNANLSGSDLTNAILTKAKLESANLTKATADGVNLSGADLEGADLSGATLHRATIDQETRLLKAKLKGTHFCYADFRNASLTEVNFSGAYLFEAKFRDARFLSCDLSGVKGGLLSGQLAGTDLTGSKLPEPTANLFEKLGSVSEISDSAKKLFLALLAACLYSWLTIGTTKDADLMTNRASSPLPIIQTAIPLVGFYVVAPIILLCVYFYFHFYLQKLWEELAQLPAIFPDGKPLYQRADPWLFNDLVRAYFSKLKTNRPFLSHFQQFISIVLAWWLVPITLLLFWGRYLPRHDIVWTCVLALILTISIVSAWRLYRLAKCTLRGEKRLTLKENLKHSGPYIVAALAMALAAGLTMLSLAAIRANPQSRVVRAMGWMRYSPFANLQDTDLSIKPPIWTGKKDEELDLVKGADMEGQNLRYANARHAFLAKANLRGSDFEEADLSDADLTYADLSPSRKPLLPEVRTHLDDADLTRARLKGANLSGTSLARAELHDADLTGAELVHSNLTGASLSLANFTGANLLGADLSGAVLFNGQGSLPADAVVPELKYANLRYAQVNEKIIRASRDWTMAFFDAQMLQRLGLPPDHNEALEEYRKSRPEEAFDSWQLKWRQKKEATAAKAKPK